MRSIKGIIIHCSATKPSMDIGVKEIDKWHKKRGWSGIGYHYVIRRDGTLETGRSIEKDGAHVKGHNKNTIGICMIGGVDSKQNPENNFTQPQFDKLNTLLQDLLFSSIVESGAYIKGHNEFSNKACPSFNVQEWLKENGF
jgi:N-acetylmuramoyl-L-alanine amidase